ncbi:MAG TPA: hypothetical protein DD733_05690 [Clostridiales bacterium]|nr:hypothetical protein [Eubacteriales bacterium]HBR31555.1 hypothetical protein [Clostridiales bacterium]
MDNTKKAFTSIAILLALVFSLTSCSLSDGITEKDDIISLFNENEDAIVSAVRNESLSEIEKIRGIQSIYISDDYIDFTCCGAGFGPSTHYYGFFYSVDDDLCAWNSGACPADGLYECGQGYKYMQSDGDNEYYVEKIGEHFFYYEAHF